MKTPNCQSFLFEDYDCVNQMLIEIGYRVKTRNAESKDRNSETLNPEQQPKGCQAQTPIDLKVKEFYKLQEPAHH